RPAGRPRPAAGRCPHGRPAHADPEPDAREGQVPRRGHPRPLHPRRRRPRPGRPARPDPLRARPDPPVAAGPGPAGGPLMSTRPTELEPWAPSAAAPWDRPRAAHLLRRAGFGGDLTAVDHLVDLGPQGAVQHLLDFDAAEDQALRADL